MQTPTFASALLTATAVLSTPTLAGDDYSPQWLVYSVNQVCQVWSDGVARCFPVAVVGPAPAYAGRRLEPLMWAQNPAPPMRAIPYPDPAAPLATVPAMAAVPNAEPPAIAAPALTSLAKPAVVVTHFEFDRADLTDADRAALDGWLAAAPRDVPIQVSGHADRLGPPVYNQKLSLRRAESVARHLIDRGRRPQGIHLLAMGETRPVVTCPGGPTPATKACLAPNRRVEINPE